MKEVATKQKFKMQVNGQELEVHAYPMARLLDVLREDCSLTGTKEGCGEGECGACSVMMDGKLVNSCLIPLIQAEASEIKTIEGLSDPDSLHPVQEAFLKFGGAQCGICTPGMVLAAVELLDHNQTPSRDEIKHALGGNLCRCTGYMRIFESVEQAVKSMSKGGQA